MKMLMQARELVEIVVGKDARLSIFSYSLEKLFSGRIGCI